MPTKWCTGPCPEPTPITEAQRKEAGIDTKPEEPPLPGEPGAPGPTNPTS